MLTRRQWYVLGGAVLLVYGASGGCYAHRLPAALQPEERRLLAQAPLPYAVAVVPWDAKAGRGWIRRPMPVAPSTGWRDQAPSPPSRWTRRAHPGPT
jgi:hypothetical protein